MCSLDRKTILFWLQLKFPINISSNSLIVLLFLFHFMVIVTGNQQQHLFGSLQYHFDENFTIELEIGENSQRP